jgi:uncharacterized protein YdhG (YjbR/CyaY superfamily)
MISRGSIPKNMDEYIGTFPKDVQIILNILRSTIRKAAPGAQEAIKYQIPTFVLQGNLVHFAAYKNHIGFYPASSGIQRFRKELSDYKLSKGTVQFPMDKSLPLPLISEIVRFRVNENLQKVAAKTQKK